MRSLRKCYLASKDVRYGMYRSILNEKYKYIMVDYLEDAQLLCIPVEESGITHEQKKELVKARELGVDIRIFSSEELMTKDLPGLRRTKDMHRELCIDNEI